MAANKPTPTPAAKPPGQAKKKPKANWPGKPQNLLERLGIDPAAEQDDLVNQVVAELNKDCSRLLHVAVGKGVRICTVVQLHVGEGQGALSSDENGLPYKSSWRTVTVNLEGWLDGTPRAVTDLAVALGSALLDVKKATGVDMVDEVEQPALPATPAPAAPVTNQ